MLAAVRWRGVLIGMGVGILAMAIMALLFWLALSALDVEGATGAATTFATLLSFPLAGWLAGRDAPFSPWFHGALGGLGIALLVVVTASRGGSPNPLPQILLLSLLAITLGGLGGHLAAARKSRFL